jgi:NAD(P)-dependent dehydrogenase (short-subunit alcohol dehydrogenase family)
MNGGDARLRRGVRVAYYLGRPAARWVEAMSRRSRTRVRNEDQTRPVALVTGGGRGLGRLVARALAHDGFAVGLVARSGDELAGSVELIEKDGGIAAAVSADVSDERAAREALAELHRRLGPIDLLVNNAGVPGPVGPAWEIEPDSWWRTLEVNLRGTYACTHAALPGMVRRRRGRIVNISSAAGVTRWPTVSAYSVSKAAVVKFTENLAYETRRHGISVFSVHPGLLPIGFSENVLPDGASTDPHERRVFEWIRRELDEGRGAEPARAVEWILRLASGRYDALSGRQLSVHDDLDAILERIDDVRERELYVLGLQTLSA